jgi:hypothetical protein
MKTRQVHQAAIHNCSISFIDTHHIEMEKKSSAGQEK